MREPQNVPWLRMVRRTRYTICGEQCLAGVQTGVAASAAAHTIINVASARAGRQIMRCAWIICIYAHSARARCICWGARIFGRVQSGITARRCLGGDDTQSEADKNRKVSVQILVGVRAYDNHFHHSYYMRVV